ncbi:MAG: Chromosomal replication initiator protein DnaA [Pseudomonadota bacterium]
MLKPRLDTVEANCTKSAQFDANSHSGVHLEGWQRACRRLRIELGEDVFNSWFGRLELDGVNDDVARLSVPTKFLKSWIQSHYTDRIIAALSSEIPGVALIAISVRTSGRNVSALKFKLVYAGNRCGAAS